MANCNKSFTSKSILSFSFLICCSISSYSLWISSSCVIAFLLKMSGSIKKLLSHLVTSVLKYLYIIYKVLNTIQCIHGMRKISLFLTRSNVFIISVCWERILKLETKAARESSKISSFIYNKCHAYVITGRSD